MMFNLVPFRLIGNARAVRYSEEQLSAAVRNATSWRQVNTRLGRSPDARLGGLRERIRGLGIDTSHIGKASARTYTDDDLRAAVAESDTWAKVAVRLGKGRRSGASLRLMRSTADRLGLDVSHLSSGRGRPAPGPERDAQIERMFAAGKTLDQIGAAFTLSPERCRQIARRVQRERAGAEPAS